METKKLKFYTLLSESLLKGVLYKDTNFDTDMSSFEKQRSQVAWKRPWNFTSPTVFVGPSPSNNINGGLISNPWLTAAMALLRTDPHMFSIVVPEDQSFIDKYGGIFHFRFWRDKWEDIIIDDFLPVDPKTDRPLFSQTTTDSELWCGLLEKAYSKFLGSYKAFKQAQAEDILTSLTNGIIEKIVLKEPGDMKQFAKMIHRFERKAFVICETTYNEHLKRNPAFGSNQLYLVTRMEHLEILKSKVALIQLKSPSGKAVQWHGHWSNSSIEWLIFNEADRETYKSPLDHSSFWMLFEDFVKHFDTVYISNHQGVTPDLPTESNEMLGRDSFWDVTWYEGSWVKDTTAGGIPTSPTGYKNPQFRFEIPVARSKMPRTITALICLSQVTLDKTASLNEIVIYIYRIPTAKMHLHYSPKDLERFAPIAHSLPTIEKTLSINLKLPPGIYVVIPCTSMPENEGRFFLQIFTDHFHQVPLELDKRPVMSVRKDLSFSLAVAKEIEIGSCLRMAIAASNSGKTECSAIVRYGFFDFTRGFYKPVKSKIDHVKIPEMSEITLVLEVPYMEYGQFLVNKKRVAAAFEVNSFDNKFFETAVEFVDIRKPRLEFDPYLSSMSGDEVLIAARFRNPLPIPLNNVCVSLAGEGIPYQNMTYNEISAASSLSVTFKIQPQSQANLIITLTLEANPIGMVQTSVEIENEISNKLLTASSENTIKSGLK